MRAYYIASLISLAIAACDATAALAQQRHRWFTPQALDSSPTGATQAIPTMAIDAPSSETDSPKTRPITPAVKRGALVSPITPRIARSRQLQVDSTNINRPIQSEVPWKTGTATADSPSMTRPLLDSVEMSHPSPRPNAMEPSERQARRPVQAQLASSAKPIGSGSDELSLLVPVPTYKLDVPAIAQPARVAMAQQPPIQQRPQPSPSDRVVDSVEVPREESPTISRFTDQTNDNSDALGQRTEHARAPTEKVKRVRPIKDLTSDQVPLLSTASMIGPLKGADELFHRLDLVDDFRNSGTLAATGPRADANQIEWMPNPYTWISPAFYHYPLYFEQPNLERYGIGRARALQPLLSSAHFFWSIPIVPYKSLKHHPRERIYTLGQGRPGNCVPLQRGVVLGPSKVGEVSMFWESSSAY